MLNSWKNTLGSINSVRESALDGNNVWKESGKIPNPTEPPRSASVRGPEPNSAPQLGSSWPSLEFFDSRMKVVQSMCEWSLPEPSAAFICLYLPRSRQAETCVQADYDGCQECPNRDGVSHCLAVTGRAATSGTSEIGSETVWNCLKQLILG